MESIGENIECDQLINKLVDKHIISGDDVSKINNLEDNAKMNELLLVLLQKDEAQALHPLTLKILQSLKNPSQQNTSRTDQAIEQASGEYNIIEW